MTTTPQPQHLPFLAALPSAVREALEALATPRSFSPGDTLFHEGEPHSQIYLLVEGRVRLEMYVRNRGHLPLLTVGPGELLGWSPLFHDRAMTATARAMEPVHALAFEGQALKSLCESNHETGYFVMRQLVQVLSDRLLATRLQLLDLFHEQSPLHQPRDGEC